MTYVITARCKDVKSGDCVEVCPVDCIHPRPGTPEFGPADQLYIDPRECIDCTACTAACPVDACVADHDLDPADEPFRALNAAYFRRS